MNKNYGLLIRRLFYIGILSFCISVKFAWAQSDHESVLDTPEAIKTFKRLNEIFDEGENTIIRKLNGKKYKAPGEFAEDIIKIRKEVEKFRNENGLDFGLYYLSDTSVKEFAEEYWEKRNESYRDGSESQNGSENKNEELSDKLAVTSPIESYRLAIILSYRGSLLSQHEGRQLAESFAQSIALNQSNNEVKCDDSTTELNLKNLENLVKTKAEHVARASSNLNNTLNSSTSSQWDKDKAIINFSNAAAEYEKLLDAYNKGFKKGSCESVPVEFQGSMMADSFEDEVSAQAEVEEKPEPEDEKNQDDSSQSSVQTQDSNQNVARTENEDSNELIVSNSRSNSKPEIFGYRQPIRKYFIKISVTDANSDIPEIVIVSAQETVNQNNLRLINGQTNESDTVPEIEIGYNIGRFYGGELSASASYLEYDLDARASITDGISTETGVSDFGLKTSKIKVNYERSIGRNSNFKWSASIGGAYTSVREIGTSTFSSPGMPDQIRRQSRNLHDFAPVIGFGLGYQLLNHLEFLLSFDYISGFEDQNVDANSIYSIGLGLKSAF